MSERELTDKLKPEYQAILDAMDFTHFVSPYAVAKYVALRCESLADQQADQQAQPQVFGQLSDAEALTLRVKDLEDLLRSTRAVCQRRGTDTAWKRLDQRIANHGIGSVTPRVFKVLPSDEEAPQARELSDEELDKIWLEAGLFSGAERRKVFVRMALAADRAIRPAAGMVSVPIDLLRVCATEDGPEQHELNQIRDILLAATEPN